MKYINEPIGSDSIDSSNPNSRAIGDVMAMQLASITYCSLIRANSVKNTIAKYLPQMQLVWEPAVPVKGEYAFIAAYGAQYIVAIRGSILNFSWGTFDNWFEQDFNILEQVPWVYTDNSSAKPMISKGANEGLNNLNKLVDSNGVTILEFLKKNAFGKGKLLSVVGHSLGANLATVYAPFLRYQMIKQRVKIPSIFSVLTFAAPCSWNKAFADEFDANFTNSWRYHNVLDIVPHSATNIAGIGLLFPNPGENASNVSVTYDGVTVTLTDACIAIQLVVAGSETYYGSTYYNVNQKRGSVPLNTGNTIFPVTGTLPVEKFFEQAGQQHAHNNYLSWLGANPLTCSL